MDRAIIEVWNTFALFMIAVIATMLFSYLYFSTVYSIDSFEAKYVYNRVKNIIQEIYNNVQEFGYSKNYTLISSIPVYLKGNGDILIIKVGNSPPMSMEMPGNLLISGEVYSKVLVFYYSYNTIYLSS